LAGAACTTIWANSGISSRDSVMSLVENPDGCPAAASSDLAWLMFSARWAMLVFVDGKTGANGLSLPMSAKPLNSAVTISGRLRVSAIAWRTRGSVNGAWSLRIESSRWLADLSLMMLYDELFSSDWAPWTT